MAQLTADFAAGVQGNKLLKEIIRVDGLMKQVAQRPRDGRTEVVEAPPPANRAGRLLIANRYSLISAGTERSKLELGSKSLLGKARARPDLVRKVADKARAAGVRSALSTARERLDALAPLGYSCAGVVLSVGAGVEGIAPGDRVACAGGGWANHAEVVAVPRNLVAHVPGGVSLDDAAYANVGANQPWPFVLAAQAHSPARGAPRRKNRPNR